jgi:ATP-dependent DNA ligase
MSEFHRFVAVLLSVRLSVVAALFSRACHCACMFCPRASYRLALPSGSKSPPSGKEWLRQIKHDGFRIIAGKIGERVKLYSRRP